MRVWGPGLASALDLLGLPPSPNSVRCGAGVGATGAFLAPLGHGDSGGGEKLCVPWVAAQLPVRSARLCSGGPRRMLSLPRAFHASMPASLHAAWREAGGCSPAAAVLPPSVRWVASAACQCAARSPALALSHRARHASGTVPPLPVPTRVCPLSCIPAPRWVPTLAFQQAKAPQDVGV